VKNIRFVNIGTHFISLAWDVAQDSHISSDVTYDVAYYAEDSAPENASVVISRYPNVTLDTLLSQTKYAFRASTFCIWQEISSCLWQNWSKLKTSWQRVILSLLYL